MVPEHCRVWLRSQNPESWHQVTGTGPDAGAISVLAVAADQLAVSRPSEGQAVPPSHHGLDGGGVPQRAESTLQIDCFQSGWSLMERPRV